MRRMIENDIRRTSRDCVALIGEWNTSNLGDRAIGYSASLDLIRQGFRVKLFTLGSFSFIGSADSQQSLEALFDASPFGTGRRPGSVAAMIVHRLLPSAKFFFRSIRNVRKAAAMRKQLYDCSVGIVGGGALLEDNGLHFPSSLYLLNIVFRSARLPLVCFGCSSSSHFSGLGRALLKGFLTSAEEVSVRDNESRTALSTIVRREMTLFGDFAHHQSYPSSHHLQVRRIGVNVMNFIGNDRHLQGHYEQYLSLLIDRLQSKAGVTIVLFTTGDSHDEDVARQMHGRFPRVEFFHSTHLAEMISFYRTVDVVFASRLHAGIMAMNEGVPAIAICVKSKIKSYFESVGLRDFCLHASSPSTIERSVDRMLDHDLKNFFASLTLSNFAGGRAAWRRYFESMSASRIGSVSV